MPRYRARPTAIVEAVRLADDLSEGVSATIATEPLPEWLIDAISQGMIRREAGNLVIKTMHGLAIARPGDYLVRQPDKVHVYPYEPSVFEAHYEEITK